MHYTGKNILTIPKTEDEVDRECNTHGKKVNSSFSFSISNQGEGGCTEWT
jgi:hypothetical protein